MHITCAAGPQREKLDVFRVLRNFLTTAPWPKPRGYRDSTATSYQLFEFTVLHIPSAWNVNPINTTTKLTEVTPIAWSISVPRNITLPKSRCQNLIKFATPTPITLSHLMALVS